LSLLRVADNLVEIFAANFGGTRSSAICDQIAKNCASSQELRAEKQQVAISQLSDRVAGNIP
jgi:hypothetical protein